MNIESSIKFHSLPVDAPLRITSPFGQRDTGIPGATTYHSGIDLGRDIYKPETRILAVAPGTVAESYWNDYRGWVSVIQHRDYRTLSQHMKYKGLSAGTKVETGQVIGIMGNSSDPDKLKVAVHLHFELQFGGVPIDPEPYLKNVQEEEYDLTETEVRAIVRDELERLEIFTNGGSRPSDWAAGFWKWGTENGITDGSNPRGLCTREQTVTMLKKLYDLIGSESAVE
ncbi:M23 family metallopeptidase [Bacilliculturomica massiliensis]|uniref:M23 family metallopeptidase n=1 Tax=Bacilliculturomica massiliensis TaxID=1917867 RepID=UPI0013EF08D0|nr:M23 family metallopeptidase [Bacilliculturomica massiliensis]